MCVPVTSKPDGKKEGGKKIKGTTYDSYVVVHYRGGKRERRRFHSLELAQVEASRVRVSLFNEAASGLTHLLWTFMQRTPALGTAALAALALAREWERATLPPSCHGHHHEGAEVSIKPQRPARKDIPRRHASPPTGAPCAPTVLDCARRRRRGGFGWTRGSSASQPSNGCLRNLARVHSG